MSWLISVGSTGFERGMNADVTTLPKCIVTSTPCHTVAQLRCAPNAGKTTSGSAGSIPACRTEEVWQNVLSSLVGI